MTKRNSIINQDVLTRDSGMFESENFLLTFHPFTFSFSLSLPVGRESERARPISRRNVVK